MVGADSEDGCGFELENHTFEEVMAHFATDEVCAGLYQVEYEDYYLKGDVPFLFSVGDPVKVQWWQLNVKIGMTFVQFMKFWVEGLPVATNFSMELYEESAKYLSRREVRFCLGLVLKTQRGLLTFKNMEDGETSKSLTKTSLSLLHWHYRQLRELMGVLPFSEMFGLFDGSEATLQDFFDAWTIAFGFRPEEIKKREL